MAKKEARISVNKLESVVHNDSKAVELYGGDGVSMEIHPVLSLREMMQFVENVVSSCFDADTGRYTPEAKEFAIRANIVTLYANFNLPTSIEKQYDLLYKSYVVSQLMEHIDTEQLKEIREAIDARIEHEVRILESTLASKTQEVINRVNSLAEQMEAIFGDVDGESLSDIVRQFTSMGDVNSDTIAEAVIKKHKQDSQDGNVVTFKKD